MVDPHRGQGPQGPPPYRRGWPGPRWSFTVEREPMPLDDHGFLGADIQRRRLEIAARH